MLTCLADCLAGSLLRYLVRLLVPGDTAVRWDLVDRDLKVQVYCRSVSGLREYIVPRPHDLLGLLLWSLIALIATWLSVNIFYIFPYI